VDRIKRISYEVLNDHKSKFGEDFADNKKILDEVSIVRSKSLKNKVAGYITKFIKKENREGKSKQSQITSTQSEESVEKEIQTETIEPTTTEESVEKEVQTETIESTTTEETITETVAEITPVEETTETKEKTE